MENAKKEIVKSRTSYILVMLLLVATGWLTFDLLFNKPEIHKGVIVKMEFIPGKIQSGQYRMGSKSRPQMNTASRHDKWMATVRMKDGRIVEVDCKQHHFENKEIGSVLHFKEFKGGTLEIKYFSHSEEDQ